ncbi:hypothetical protein ACROYT_G043023 [Oculina patagonica]
MGVLNVQEQLRHRRSRDMVENYGNDHVWEEEVLEPAPVQPPQQETNQRRHSRNRSQKNKIQYYNSKNNGRKVKTGNRPMRRHENMCFLLSLVDHEEIGEFDLSDLVNNNKSVFATLFTNEENMQIWNKFVSLSEEEQEVIVAGKTKTAAVGKDIDRGSTDDDRNIPTERDAVAVAEKSFNRIEGRIRGTLMNRRFPMGGLKHHEEEVISYFSVDPSAVMSSTVPSSFDRLLVHGVCQFLDLKSTSMDRNGNRIMEIENNHETFCIPSLLLSQYLEQHR